MISAAILAVYSGILVELLVLKNVSFKIGHLMFNFTGHATGPANFVPFKTIVPYLFLEKGLVITVFELAGNIGLFVPLGCIVPFVYPKMTWKKSLILAIAAPLAIEVIQAVFRVGIFDTDDILLNGLGVMIGYWVFTAFVKIMKD